MFYVGIDPGKAGAIVVINKTVDEGEFWDTPIDKSHPTGYDVKQMAGIVAHCQDKYKPKFAIESLLYMPGKKNAQGLKSAGTSGIGWGIWWGIFHSFQVEVMPPVHPRTWQSQLFKNIPKEVTGKQRAVHVVNEMGSPIPLKRSERQNAKLMDGRADAFCIALWVMLADRQTIDEVKPDKVISKESNLCKEVFGRKESLIKL